MCTVLLPLGVNPIAVNKYIISYICNEISFTRGKGLLEESNGKHERGKIKERRDKEYLQKNRGREEKQVKEGNKNGKGGGYQRGRKRSKYKTKTEQIQK
jgi:hypothetical protein